MADSLKLVNTLRVRHPPNNPSLASPRAIAYFENTPFLDHYPSLSLT